MQAKMVYRIPAGQGELDFDDISFDRRDKETAAIVLTNESGNKVEILINRKELRQLATWQILRGL